MNIWVTEQVFKTYVYSGELKLIYMLIILMLLDIVTGVLKALVQKKLWSRKSTYGFGRKILVFFIIVLANIIDNVFNFNGVLVYATVIFYILNECLSIIENYALLGGKIPKQLEETLALLQEKNDATDQIEKIITKPDETVKIEVTKESDHIENK